MEDLSGRVVKVVSSDGSIEYAKIYNMEAVIRFLELNYFRPSEEGYTNGDCEVVIRDKYFEVRWHKGMMLSESLNIYWLIGVLTYHDLIDKNFKQ